jgi:hypothetical protein
MNRHHINGRTIYVMWREKRLWNVCVLQRVRSSNLVPDYRHMFGPSAVDIGL